ncbi:glycosyltransferase family 4 protein [Pantoea phytobeneficialis]|uniref:Glycosyltransferase family 4 protein n=1 Tax=Pantoea phytobeneficialis TaxID=2052056 RepID=A0AAP9HAJ3_9GAMM|nr:glycosyltransferase family 4 protein [Pantoea phytobeneficialis]MDO6407405.1 glycosyltransferase family 4 protein [Pantoea phytobeneficialis]QGR09546.1 hypothetical protein CTZ24_24085 [Pantoea phytobeneficialis]
MNKVLVVSGDCPYPANHGGRLDILQRIELLSKSGFDIELIITHKEDVDRKSKEYLSKLCSNVYYVKRLSFKKSIILSVLTLLPIQATSRYNLKAIKIKSKFDAVICESEYVYPILKNASLNTNKKLLRVHNNESVYYEGLFRDEKNPLKKLYYKIESLLFKVNESKINEKFTKLMFISSDEYAVNNKRGNSEWLPPHMPAVKEFREEKFSAKKANVLFVGNLFMPNNLKGIIWYLEEVHEKILSQSPDVVLTIAGNAKNGIDSDLLKAISRFEDGKVSLIQSPTDQELNDIYDQNCIFINPMLNGAGVKLKNLDAMRNSFCVITTTIGAEGTGVIDNEHVFIADDVACFERAVIMAISEDGMAKNMAINAYMFIEKNYNSQNTLLRIMKES